MKIPAEGKLLRVFIGEQDKWRGLPLYEAIVNVARKEKLAGATVLKGCMGFGCKSHSEEKIMAFLPHLDEMVSEGLITLEKVNVIMYRAKPVG